MHFTTIFASATALVASAQASNAHIADFRVYGTAACLESSYHGIWTVTGEDVNKCVSLHKNSADAISGVTLGNITPGFKLSVYRDVDCKSEMENSPVGTCKGDSNQWASFLVTRT